MLLEALIAILLFSMGILALIGLQAIAIKNTADAKYRAEAAFLANQIIGQMWADNPANLASYASGNANVTTWLGNATTPGTVAGSLPDPTGQIAIGAGNVMTVTVCWKGPQEPLPRHCYVAVAQING